MITTTIHRVIRDTYHRIIRHTVTHIPTSNIEEPITPVHHILKTYDKKGREHWIENIEGNRIDTKA